MSFKHYYSSVKDYLDSHYNNSYSHIYLNDVIPIFSVKVWNMDNMMNKHIKINNKHSHSTPGVRRYSTISPYKIGEVNEIKPYRFSVVQWILKLLI